MKTKFESPKEIQNHPFCFQFLILIFCIINIIKYVRYLENSQKMFWREWIPRPAFFKLKHQIKLHDISSKKLQFDTKFSARECCFEIQNSHGYIVFKKNETIILMEIRIAKKLIKQKLRALKNKNLIQLHAFL